MTEIFMVVIICAVAAILGASGYSIRKGQMYKEALEKGRRGLISQGISINEQRYKDEMKKAQKRINIPVISWITIYGFIFFVTVLVNENFGSFLLSLLLLIPVGLGYFGVFFLPSPEGFIEDL